ncbi:MAG: hypothetical protein HQ551_02835 [Desulfobacteraceae bacterium]|nr:hypothetical protein [Desulfobacteraceae bacterium]
MRILRNDGISIVALVIALLLLSTLGTVLTSLIITKQKSALLPLKSAQAFYAAQAGIEYAIRYAADNQAAFLANPNNIFPDTPNALTKNLDTGSFTVEYNNPNDSINSIRSTGTAGTAKRVITLALFPTYVATADITLDLPDNPPDSHNKKITIPIRNNTGGTLYIFQIDMAKDLGGELEKIEFGNNEVYDEDITISSDHGIPTPIDFSEEPYYYPLPTGTTSNEFKFDDKVAVDTYTVIYHYYFEGGSEADDYTSKVKF